MTPRTSPRTLREPSPAQRCIVWLMVGLQLLSGIPLHALETLAAPDPVRTASKAPAAPPLVRTPAQVQVQRVLPAHTPASQLPTLGTNATDADILASRVFAAPLRPVAPTASGGVLQGLRRALGTTPSKKSPDENVALQSLLNGLAQSSDAHDTASLDQFLTAYPESRWSPALRNELARRQFAQGYFQRAIEQWESVWKSTRDATDPGSVAVADEVLSSLIEAALGLSDTRRLSRLVGEAEKRPGNNVLDGKLERAKQSIWLLRHKGGQNVMCGPLALHAILQHQQKPFDPIRLDTVTDDYIATGLPITELAKHADHFSLGLRIARRTTATDIPVPAVLHARGGHYSSIVDRDGDRYFLVDRAMQFAGWVPREAIDEQASGYFLVPAAALGSGFTEVPVAEAATVFGRDGLHGQEPNGPNSTPCAQTAGGTCNSCRGMPQYSFNAKLAAVRIQDNPLGYTPPVGPAVNFMLTYADLDDSKPATSPAFSNAGRVWAIDWVAWIDPIAGNPTASSRITVHVPGGGTEISRYIPAATAFGPNDRSQATVRKLSNTSYVRLLPDGSSEFYETPDNPAAPNRIFLTRIVDDAGNAVSLTYDANLRLVGITDAIGQVTTLEYGVAADLWKITRVTDPFGRSARLTYDASGRLESITDTLGLRSSFTYDSAEFITSMTTPYGTTTFTKVQGSPAYNRTITATDPLGAQERIQFIEPIDLPTTSPSVPANVTVGGQTVSFRAETARLGFRNSFYWSKQAMQQRPGDVTAARNYRWFTDASYLVTGVMESMREPLEDPIWFNYPGQATGSQPYYAGVTANPDKILRVLPDGTPQLLQMGRNPLGRLTNLVDPVGRNTIFVYGTNQVDLLEIHQRTSTNTLDRLVRITYDAKHRPLTLTDAAGGVSTYTYNARGQMLTSTNPKGEVRTFSYETNGYLTSIDGPLPGNADRMTFTYDAFGRIRTVRNVDGATATYDYDAMDRTTVVTHGDGTFEQFTYDRLDQVESRDRLGRVDRFRYDPLQRLVASIDALGRETTYDWCTCGSLGALIDPMGRQTRWSYDLQGRTIGKEYADGSRLELAYESGTSRVHQAIDEKGQFTVFEYGTDDQVTRVHYPNAAVPTPAVEFGYDPRYPRLTRMTDGTGVTTFTWHPASLTPSPGGGQLATIDGPLPNDTQTFAYDSLGRVIGRSVGGVTTQADFDPLGRIRSITNPLGQFQIDFQGSSARVEKMTFPNGVVSTYSYSNPAVDGRVTEIRHDRGATLLSKFGFAHNPTGEVTTWTIEQAGPAASHALSHDAAGQLTRSVRSTTGSASQTTDYSYDRAGNRTVVNSGAGRREFAYNALNEIASSSSATTSTTYEWDAAQRLAAVVRGDRRSEFQYDGIGRRVRITEKQGATVLQDRRYVWSGSSIVEERDGTGATVLRRFFGQGEQILQGPATGTYCYTWDHLGSVREMTDSTGAVRARYEYDLWGQQTRVAGDLDAAFGFTGFFQHSPSGLALSTYRAYDPTIGRWISRDPIGELGPDGANLYAYVRNNPTSYVDPNGEFAWIAAGAVIGAVVNVGITYIANGGNVTGRQLAAAAASGAIAGALGAAAGPLGGTIARGLGMASSGLGATVAAGGLSAGASALGQAAANAIDPCNASSVLNAALWGGIGGGIAKGLFPTRNLNSWAQARYFGPRTFSGLFRSSNGWRNLGSFGTSSGVGGAANFPGINPF